MWMAASLLLSAAATEGVRRFAPRAGMLDLPGPRRSHGVPTPRGGGAGVALVGLAAFAVFAWLGSAGAGWMGAGLLLVAAAGWRDDRRPLAPGWRLAAQLLAGVCLALALARAQAAPAVVVLGFVAVPVLVNAWNFIDGIDGLAASQALLCALALAWGLQEAGRWLALALIAACLGFLPFNVPRARVFAGDVGSSALGYLLACLLGLALQACPPARWPLLALPLAAVLVDTGLTLLRRILRRERWWQPHLQHLYQRWARALGHPRVTLRYAAWTALAIACMVWLQTVPIAWAYGGCGAFLGASTWLWWRGQARAGAEGVA
ncbi:hypothetical protein LJB71_07935 [Thermomonas sp. S9]|uniref:hypothetical protein n=1 Tax=Thermomonas sp. S9 TaxID=2885203 RepID=UPI00216AE1AD|nr:hypothetical protein [Thermomonas sp. S9]MCR6496149.1 hypothetical protein [Thermomonas sp. S9]